MTSHSPVKFGPYTLAPHQVQYREVFRTQKCLFAYGDAGVGKTVGLLYAAQEHKGPVVVVSRSAAQNGVWGREIRLTCNTSMHVLESRNSPAPSPLPAFTFISWALLPYVAPQMVEAMRRDNALIIFDESHRGKNHKRYRVSLDQEGKTCFAPTFDTPYWASQLSRAATSRMVATAWPMPNSVTELWAQLDLMQPGKWGKYRDFAALYTDARRTEYGFVYEGRRNMPRLKALLAPVMVRTRASDAVSMGFPSVITSRVDLPGVAKLTQAAIKRAGFGKLSEEAILAGVNSGVYTSSTLEALLAENVARKFPAFKRYIGDLLDDFARLKAIVYVTRVDHVEDLCESMSKIVDVIGVHASTPDRDGKRDAFWAHPGPCLYICTGQSEGESANLQCASHVFFLHLPYTVAEIIQWRGRAVRAGATTATVWEEYLMIEGALDTRLMAILLGKIDSVSGLNEDDAAFLAGLSDTIEGIKKDANLLALSERFG